MQQTDTEKLICLAGEGDALAVEQLLVRGRERIRRMVAVRMDPRLAGRFDPSDVVQESLADAARRLPQYLKERPMPFHAWLRQIAWNRLVDLHRRHLQTQARSVTREEEVGLSEASLAALADHLASSGTGPAGHLLRKELQQRVRTALSAMKSADRELLIMRHLEQLQMNEIAAVLQISEEAAMSRGRRALERLQLLLGDDVMGDAG